MSACASAPAKLPPAPVAAAAPQPVLPRPARQPATPREVRAEIARWFTAAGYKGFQVAALVEHAGIESGYHPCAAGPAGLRYTFQWGGIRLRRLHAFARSPGCPPLDTQLAFADRELRGEPAFSCFLQTSTGAAALVALRRGFGRGSC